MKFKYLFFLLIPLFVASCHSGKGTQYPKVTFGIYETIQNDSIPTALIDSLKSRQFQFEGNPELTILGYITRSDSSILDNVRPPDKIKLVTLVNPVDNNGKYLAVVAIRPLPIITISDLKKASVQGSDVKLTFNMQGTLKLAELTKNNIGKKIAIVINNQIYSMPMVNAELKDGLALIVLQEQTGEAEKISGSLNSSLP